ncbi:unnamed protein product, partial [Callosobruchus maculatus]
PRRWIGRSGTIAWPARSPDLNPLDFLYWGCLKDRVYAKTIQNEEHLRQQINSAVQEISQMNLRMLKRSFLQRCRACIRMEGRQFERRKRMFSHGYKIVFMKLLFDYGSATVDEFLTKRIVENLYICTHSHKK